MQNPIAPHEIPLGHEPIAEGLTAEEAEALAMRKADRESLVVIECGRLSVWIRMNDFWRVPSLSASFLDQCQRVGGGHENQCLLRDQNRPVALGGEKGKS